MADVVRISPRAGRRAGAGKGAKGKDAGARSSGNVQSLTRALRVMNALAEHLHGLTLSDLAQTVGLPTSTAHRLLTTMQNERYVRFDAERSVWLIGVQAFQVGSSFLRSRDLVSSARPYMRRLMEMSGETVNLVVVDHGEVVYLAQVECHKVMRAIAGPGGRARMHNSAVGKAILSWWPEEEVARVLESRGLPRETANTIVTPAALRKDLAATRTRGYAVDDEENAAGLRCVASVIFDENAAPMAGLSVSGPVTRLPENRIPALGVNVARIAGEITAQLGGRLPASFPAF